MTSTIPTLTRSEDGDMTTNLVRPPVRTRVTPNVTPFTYYDGLTYLEILEALRMWLKDILLPGFEDLKSYIDSEISRVESDIEDVNTRVDSAWERLHEHSDSISQLESLVQSIIDNSVEIQDAVVATIINDALSETRDALDSRYQTLDSLTINVLDHGVIGDGVADDTVALQSITDDSPNDAHLWAPLGTVIRTTGTIIPQGKGISFDFENVSFIQVGNEPIISGEGAWDGPYVVGSVVNRTGSSVVTVNDASMFGARDLIKVVSDDFIAEARDPGDGRRARQGEFATITGISGNAITVSPGFYDTYNFESNIRIYKMIPARVSVTIKDANYTGASGGFSDRAFHFTSMVRPKLKGHVSRSRGTVVTFVGCYGATAHLTVDYAPWDVGYIVNSGGSVMGSYDVGAMQCRHLYTDNAPMITGTMTAPDRYGRPMYDTITAKSFGNGGSASVDTHHGGVAHTFTGIKAVGHPGNPAFQMRGVKHTLVNCEAMGGDVGFTVVDEAFWGRYDYVPAAEISLVNCKTRDVNTPFRVDKSQNDAPSSYPEPTLTVDGGTFEYHGGHPRFLNAHVFLNNPHMIYTGRVLDGAAMSLIGSGSLIGDVTMRILQGSSGSLGTIIRVGTGPAARTIDIDVDMWLNGYTQQNTQYFASVTSGTIGQVRGRLVSARDSKITPMNGLTGATAQDISVILKASRLQTVDERWQGTTAWGGKTLKNGSNITLMFGDDHVTFDLTASEPVLTGAVGLGAFPGQQLTLVCNRYGSAVTIRHGATYNTDMGGNQELQPGESLRLVWNGLRGLWVNV